MCWTYWFHNTVVIVPSQYVFACKRNFLDPCVIVCIFLSTLEFWWWDLTTKIFIVWSEPSIADLKGCSVNPSLSTLWQDIGKSTSQEFCMTRLYGFEHLTQSVWNVCIKFDTWKEHWKLSFLEVKHCCYKRKRMLRENHVNGESRSLELTI